MKLAIGIVLFALGITGCGGSSDGGGGGANAADVAAGLKSDISSITKTVEITEDNDPNGDIGRPGKYAEAISIYDSRVTCASELDISCGAKIEVWRSEDDAQARMDYIQDTLKAAQILGSEYDYIHGGILVRVSGDLKPSEAKEYEDSLG